jgi:hypothetical protein
MFLGEVMGEEVTRETDVFSAFPVSFYDTFGAYFNKVNGKRAIKAFGSL